MNPFFKNLALWLVISLLMVLLFNFFNKGAQTSKPMDYTAFLEMVDRDR